MSEAPRRLYAEQEKEVEEARSKLIGLKGDVEQTSREEEAIQLQLSVNATKEVFHPSRAVSSKWNKHWRGQK